MAASSVDTWKSLSASSTCAAVAKGSNLIFARDSEILIIASSCLQGNSIILQALVHAPVVQRADNFIHWISHNVANKCVQEFPYSPTICV